MLAVGSDWPLVGSPEITDVAAGPLPPASTTPSKRPSPRTSAAITPTSGRRRPHHHLHCFLRRALPLPQDTFEFVQPNGSPRPGKWARYHRTGQALNIPCNLNCHIFSYCLRLRPAYRHSCDGMTAPPIAARPGHHESPLPPLLAACGGGGGNDSTGRAGDLTNPATSPPLRPGRNLQTSSFSTPNNIQPLPPIGNQGAAGPTGGEATPARPANAAQRTPSSHGDTPSGIAEKCGHHHRRTSQR